MPAIELYGTEQYAAIKLFLCQKNDPVIVIQLCLWLHNMTEHIIYV